jgi:hypothetical protein
MVSSLCAESEQNLGKVRLRLLLEIGKWGAYTHTRSTHEDSAGVNARNLCRATSWRMSSLHELERMWMRYSE